MIVECCTYCFTCKHSTFTVVWKVRISRMILISTGSADSNKSNKTQNLEAHLRLMASIICQRKASPTCIVTSQLVWINLSFRPWQNITRDNFAVNRVSRNTSMSRKNSFLRRKKAKTYDRCWSLWTVFVTYDVRN